MNVTRFLDHVESDRRYRNQITHVQVIPAKPARYADTQAPLHPLLRQALAGMKIERLYSHQAEAIDAAMQGRHTVVISGTASGKTLCYNLPVLHTLLSGQKVKLCTYIPPKRWRKTSCAVCCALKSYARIFPFTPAHTTATPRRKHDVVCATTATAYSPIPICCTQGSYQTMRVGPNSSPLCSGWSSTRSIPIAVYSDQM